MRGSTFCRRPYTYIYLPILAIPYKLKFVFKYMYCNTLGLVFIRFKPHLEIRTVEEKFEAQIVEKLKTVSLGKIY